MNPYQMQGVISSDEDFNNLTEFGIYTISTPTTNNLNVPSTEISYGTVLVYGHGSSPKRVSQVVIDTMGGRIWTRRYFDGWSSWLQV